MGWVTTEFDNTTRSFNVVLKPYKSDMDVFKIVKTRHPQNCANCGKRIPSKSFCYGREWIRLCLDCGKEFIEVGIKTFEEITKSIKESQEEHKKKEKDWEATNVLAKL